MSRPGDRFALAASRQPDYRTLVEEGAPKHQEPSRLRSVLNNPYFRKFVLGIVLAAIVAGIVFIPGAQVIFGIAGAMAAAHGVVAAVHFPLFAEVLTVAAAALFPFMGDLLGRLSQGLTWLFVSLPAEAAHKLSTPNDNDGLFTWIAKKITAPCATFLANVLWLAIFPIVTPLRIAGTGIQIAVSYVTTGKPGLPERDIREDLPWHELLSVKLTRLIFAGYKFKQGYAGGLGWLMLMAGNGLLILLSRPFNWLADKARGDGNSGPRNFVYELLELTSKIFAIPGALFYLVGNGFYSMAKLADKPFFSMHFINAIESTRTGKQMNAEVPPQQQAAPALNPDARGTGLPPQPAMFVWLLSNESDDYFAPQILENGKYKPFYRKDEERNTFDAIDFHREHYPQMFWRRNADAFDKASLYCTFTGEDGQGREEGPYYLVDGNSRVASIITATVQANGQVEAHFIFERDELAFPLVDPAIVAQQAALAVSTPVAQQGDWLLEKTGQNLQMSHRNPAGGAYWVAFDEKAKLHWVTPGPGCEAADWGMGFFKPANGSTYVFSKPESNFGCIRASNGGYLRYEYYEDAQGKWTARAMQAGSPNVKVKVDVDGKRSLVECLGFESTPVSRVRFDNGQGRVVSILTNELPVPPKNCGYVQMENGAIMLMTGERPPLRRGYAYVQDEDLIWRPKLNDANSASLSAAPPALPTGRKFIVDEKMSPAVVLSYADGTEETHSLFTTDMMSLEFKCDPSRITIHWVSTLNGSKSLHYKYVEDKGFDGEVYYITPPLIHRLGENDWGPKPGDQARVEQSPMLLKIKIPGMRDELPALMHLSASELTPAQSSLLSPGTGSNPAAPSPAAPAAQLVVSSAHHAGLPSLLADDGDDLQAFLPAAPHAPEPAAPRRQEKPKKSPFDTITPEEAAFARSSQAAGALPELLHQDSQRGLSTVEQLRRMAQQPQPPAALVAEVAGRTSSPVLGVGAPAVVTPPQTVPAPDPFDGLFDM